MALKCIRDDALNASLKISVHANPLIGEVIAEIENDREMASKKAMEKASSSELTL